MFTTRMSPNTSVKPLATTKYSAAAVRPFSSVMKKSFGSETAEPKLVPDAMNSTQTIGKTISATSSVRFVLRSAADPAIPRRPYVGVALIAPLLSQLGGPGAQAGCPIPLSRGQRPRRDTTRRAAKSSSGLPISPNDRRRAR